MRASEKPDRRDRQSTIGSRTNISNGRAQVVRISLVEKRFSFSSLGPQMFSPVALRLFLASRSRMTVERVSGTRKKWASCTTPPRISYRRCQQPKLERHGWLESPGIMYCRHSPAPRSSNAS